MTLIAELIATLGLSAATAGVAALVIIAAGLLTTTLAFLDKIRSGSTSEKVLALNSLNNSLTPYLRSALGLSVATEAGLLPETIVNSLDDAIRAKKASLALVVTYPTFASVAQAQTWIQQYAIQWAQGILTDAQYAPIKSWYYTEYDRLTAVAPPQAVTPPAAAPVAQVTAGGVTTQVAISGFSFLPTINVGAPQISVLPTPIQNILEAPQVYTNIDTTGLGTSIGALSAALPAILTGALAQAATMASKWGHESNMGRNTCLGSTALSLIGNLAGGVAPLLLWSNVEKLGPLKAVLDDQFKKLWDGLVNDPVFAAPVTPERSPQISEHLFLKAMELGLKAHLISVVAESFAPLKTLGLGQFAAQLADMAGFAKIGGAMMSALETQALVRPFGYYVNQRVRSLIPDSGTLQRLAGEYALVPRGDFDRLTLQESGIDSLESLNVAEFKKWMVYHGYADEWLPKLYELTDRPVSYFALRAIANAGVYDETFYIRELANNGYNPPAMHQMLKMLRRMSNASEYTALIADAKADYIDGFLSEAELRSQLATWGRNDSQIAAIVTSAEGRRDRTWDKQHINYLVAACIAGRITTAELNVQLGSMGVDNGRIKQLIEEVSLRSQVEVPVDTVTTVEKALISEIKEHVLLGIMPLADYRTRLAKVGYSPDEAAIMVETIGLESQRQTYEKTHPKAKEPVPYYDTDAGKIEVDTIRRVRRQMVLMPEEEQRALESLEMPADFAAAIVNNDSARLKEEVTVGVALTSVQVSLSITEGALAPAEIAVIKAAPELLPVAVSLSIIEAETVALPLPPDAVLLSITFWGYKEEEYVAAVAS